MCYNCPNYGAILQPAGNVGQATCDPVRLPVVPWSVVRGPWSVVHGPVPVPWSAPMARSHVIHHSRYEPTPVPHCRRPRTSDLPSSRPLSLAAYQCSATGYWLTPPAVSQPPHRSAPFLTIFSAPLPVCRCPATTCKSPPRNWCDSATPTLHAPRPPHRFRTVPHHFLDLARRLSLPRNHLQILTRKWCDSSTPTLLRPTRSTRSHAPRSPRSTLPTLHTLHAPHALTPHAPRSTRSTRPLWKRVCAGGDASLRSLP